MASHSTTTSNASGLPLRFRLANNGHDTRALQAYLGHRNIQHTVRHTELSPTRFKDFWRDTASGKESGRDRKILAHLRTLPRVAPESWRPSLLNRKLLRFLPIINGGLRPWRTTFTRSISSCRSQSF